MDPSIFAPLPPLPNLRVARQVTQKTQSAVLPTTRTLRDRNRATPATSTSSTAGAVPVSRAPVSRVAGSKEPTAARTPVTRTPVSSPPKLTSAAKKGRRTSGVAPAQQASPPPVPKLIGGNNSLPAQESVSPNRRAPGIPSSSVPAVITPDSSPIRNVGARLPPSPASALQAPLMIRIKLPARVKSQTPTSPPSGASEPTMPVSGTSQ